MSVALYPRAWVRTAVQRRGLLPSPRRWVTSGAGRARDRRVGMWRAKVGFLRHFLP